MPQSNARGTWPKIRPPLNPDQARALEDWYRHWLETGMPGQFGAITDFGHTYALRSMTPGAKTLEIGPGNGAHLAYEDLTKSGGYVGLELRASLSNAIEQKYPKVRIVVGDCQERIDIPDNTFDRAIAVHVLEHLTDLPAALAEIARVLKPGGKLSVVIPCEAGLGYSLGRVFTTKRTFEKRYGCEYEPIIRHEHVNTAREVLREVKRLFRVEHRSFYPMRVPLVDVNLIIGLTLVSLKGT